VKRREEKNLCSAGQIDARESSDGWVERDKGRGSAATS